jgi:hypothetical protein
LEAFPHTPAVQRMKGPAVPTRRARGRVSTSIHIKVRTLTFCMWLDPRPRGTHPRPTARTTLASIGAFYFLMCGDFPCSQMKAGGPRHARPPYIPPSLPLWDSDGAPPVLSPTHCSAPPTMSSADLKCPRVCTAVCAVHVASLGAMSAMMTDRSVAIAATLVRSPCISAPA